MKRFLTIITSVFLLAVNLCGQGIGGPWKGELDFGTYKLAIVFHFDAEGCTMDSPDQGAMGMSAELAYMSADSVCVVQKSLDASFSGRVLGDRIVGRFSQRGLSMPLVLLNPSPTRPKRLPLPTGMQPLQVPFPTLRVGTERRRFLWQ